LFGGGGEWDRGNNGKEEKCLEFFQEKRKATESRGGGVKKT